jgi:hypothetical protein
VICKYILEPAATNCGYTAVRADQISEPGLITTQVIQHLVNDPMVVADLTGRNPNVYYELAVRHALRKPFIQLIQKGEQIPFDIAGMRTIPVDHQDVAVAEEAKAEIIRQMKSMEGEDATVDSPISVAIDMDILRRSGNPQDRQLADVFAAVTELNTAFTSLEKKISDSTNLLVSHLSSVLTGPVSTTDIRFQQSDAAPHTFERILANKMDSLRSMVERTVGALRPEDRVEITNTYNLIENMYNELLADRHKLDTVIRESDRRPPSNRTNT